MRVLRVLASVMFVSGLAALPACAQRGGSHSGGGSAGHAAPAFHSSGGSGRPSFAPAARFGGGYAHGPAPAHVGGGGRGYGNGGGYRGPRRYGYGGVGAIGWVGPGYLSYGDSGPYVDASDAGDIDQGSPDVGDEIAAVPYIDQPPVPDAPQEGYAPGPYAAPPVAAPYQQASQRAARQAPPLPEEDAVTIVFKDGRTPLQVHNYMLTTTMLYVRDRGRRDIPLSDVDLAATQIANRNSGVEFQVPGAK